MKTALPVSSQGSPRPPAGGPGATSLDLRTLFDHVPGVFVLHDRPDFPHFQAVLRDFGGGVVELTAFRGDLAPVPRVHLGAVAEKVCRARTKAEMTEEDIKRSVQRSRRLLRHKLFMLGADRLLTLTYRENKTDLKAAWQDFARFVRLMTKQIPAFRYCCVPERQQRGAVHFHLAIKGFLNVNVVRFLWRKAIKGEGNIDISAPRGSGGAWQRAKLAAYLAKYMSKGMGEAAANLRRYSSTHDLPAPASYRFYIPIGDAAVYTMSRVVSILSRRTVSRLFEASGPFPVVWMATY